MKIYKILVNPQEVKFVGQGSIPQFDDSLPELEIPLTEDQIRKLIKDNPELREIEHCAEKDCPECNKVAYKAGYEAGKEQIKIDMLWEGNDRCCTRLGTFGCACKECHAKIVSLLELYGKEIGHYPFSRTGESQVNKRFDDLESRITDIEVSLIKEMNERIKKLEAETIMTKGI